MFNIVAFLSGLVFGIGLILSRMADPAKVPELSGLHRQLGPIAGICHDRRHRCRPHRLLPGQNRPSSLLDKPIELPAATRIDKRLVLGSILFGTGWGLAGICPGPAIVTLSAGMAPA